MLSCTSTRKLSQEGDLTTIRQLALVDIGDFRSIEPLIKTLRDQDANIRIVALRALNKITGESLSGDPEAWLKWWNGTKKGENPS